MTDARPPRAHADLLRRARAGEATLDAIVVPASRDAENLEVALGLGAELEVDVVVLCSRDTKMCDVLALADLIEGSRCAALDVTTAQTGILPSFETAGFLDAIAGSRGDLSFKRNLGLLLGRMAGWRNLLFLDDDIFDIRPDQVRRAAASLTHHSAVGMPAEDFPDNSVVYHARRLAERDQGVFVSGSALLVDLERSRSFFPETYNEDWLFLAPYLSDGTVAVAGPVRQHEYSPFEDPYRARSEEFGDVLAEGLIGGLHRGLPSDEASSQDYWEHFLEARREFIAATVARCEKSDDPKAGQAVLALRTAEEARATLSASLFTDYLAAWKNDLDRWQDFLDGVRPARLSVLAAAAELSVRCEASALYPTAQSTTIPAI